MCGVLHPAFILTTYFIQLVTIFYYSLTCFTTSITVPSLYSITATILSVSSTRSGVPVNFSTSFFNCSIDFNFIPAASNFSIKSVLLGFTQIPLSVTKTSTVSPGVTILYQLR